MTLLRKLGAIFRGRPGAEDDAAAIIFHVRCAHCGEIIRVRAHRRWDLVQEFDDGISGYTLHKDVLGTRCNRMLRVHITFDRQYRITNSEVDGGQFVTPDEHQVGPP